MNHVNLPEPTRVVGVMAVAAVLVVAGACGSAERPDGDATPTTTMVEPDEPVEGALPTLPEVEFESDPVGGAALFGSDTAADDTAADDAGSPTEVAAEPLDDVAVEPDARESAEPERATAAPGWAPFCHLLDQIARAELPSDPDEQLFVVRTWLGALRPHTPAEITADFLLLQQTIEAVESIDQLENLDAARMERIGEAGSRIDDAVDRSCP